MKTLQDIENEIIEVTNQIKVSYPELYTNLDEIPMTIPSRNNPEVTAKDMAYYLESLKQILKHYTKIKKT